MTMDKKQQTFNEVIQQARYQNFCVSGGGAPAPG